MSTSGSLRYGTAQRYDINRVWNALKYPPSLPRARFKPRLPKTTGSKGAIVSCEFQWCDVTDDSQFFVSLIDSFIVNRSAKTNLLHL